jgi:O-antigen/teichoic acid export membrane protein
VYSYLKKVTQHSAVYTMGNMATLLPSFVLIPLYTRYFGPAEYGAMALVLLLSNILMMFYESGMVGALSRQYFEYGEEEAAKRKTAVATAFTFVMSMSILLSSAVLLNSERISFLIMSDHKYASIVRIMALSTFFGSIAVIPQTLLRLQQKSLVYITLSSVLVISSITFNVLFLVVFKKGLESVFLANLVTAVISSVLFMVFTFRSFIAPRLSSGDLKEMLKFGALLLPVAFMSWIVDYSGRYILEKMVNLHDVGVYSLGYKIAQVIMLLVKAFIAAWFPIIFMIMKEDRARRIFADIFVYFIFAFAFIALAISVFGREIINILSRGDYRDAYKVIPLISLSCVLFGIYQFFASFLVAKKRFETQPFLLIATAIVNIALNIIFIAYLGMMGCAVATLASYVILSVATYKFSQRHYRIEIDGARLTKIAAPMVLIIAIGSYIRVEPMAAALAVKVALLALYLGSLYFFGFFRKEEIVKLKDLFKRYEKAAGGTF